MADRDKVIAALERRMVGGDTFTYRELCKIAHANGFDENSIGNKHRFVDTLIQRWRKNGWISYVRHGRDTFWSLTEIGRAQKASA